MTIDLEKWKAALDADQRVDYCSRCVAFTIATHLFDTGNCRLSAEHIADEASAAMTLEASTVRGAIKRLRRYGWIQVDTDPGSKRLSCGRPCHPIIRLCAAAVMR